MTVGELKQQLYELSEEGKINEDTEVRMAQQPHWAFEYAFGDNVAVARPEEGKAPCLYLEEGYQIDYLSEEAARQLGGQWHGE